MQENMATAHKMLFINTLAFTVCFAVWMLNGVLVTFLVSNGIYDWTPIEIGWLIGVPVLTGAIFRLPAGILTDKLGGKPIFSYLLFFCAIPVFLLSYCTEYWHFILCSFGFGLIGTSFSIGIAFTSMWYPKKNQGTALGIFGAGNAGAAITTLLAPTILKILTDNGNNLEEWRQLPFYYSISLIIMGIIFVLFTKNKKSAVIQSKTVIEMLKPLKEVRVWRFGLYYFLVFGCFVAFSQWLVSYFVNVYTLSLITAGFFASCFSLPSGLIRALGGWMSDKWGARKVMFWTLATSTIISLLLIVPRMEILSPGKGVNAYIAGIVTTVDKNTVIIKNKNKKEEIIYNINIRKVENIALNIYNTNEDILIWPIKTIWQETIVQEGEYIQKGSLLAKGITRIYFQANVWIFACLVIILGSIWGIGKAAVYKYIPDYFPGQVGVVGGMVGVLGGLGGFCGPVIFGYLLEWTGLWTSCWIFMFLLSAVSWFWLYTKTRT